MGYAFSNICYTDNATNAYIGNGEKYKIDGTIAVQCEVNMSSVVNVCPSGWRTSIAPSEQQQKTLYLSMWTQRDLFQSELQVLFRGEHVEQRCLASRYVQCDAGVVQLHTRERSHTSRFDWWVNDDKMFTFPCASILQRQRIFSVFAYNARGRLWTDENSGTIGGKMHSIRIFEAAAWITWKLVDPWASWETGSGKFFVFLHSFVPNMSGIDKRVTHIIWS